MTTGGGLVGVPDGLRVAVADGDAVTVGVDVGSDEDVNVAVAVTEGFSVGAFVADKVSVTVGSAFTISVIARAISPPSIVVDPWTSIWSPTITDFDPGIVIGTRTLSPATAQFDPAID